MIDKEIEMTNVYEKGIITGLDRVRWQSAIGTLEGTVKRIDNAKNAAGDWIEWYIIGDVYEVGRGINHRDDYTCRIPVTSFASLSMNVINR